MKILIVCDEGLNRSHTIKGRLQYWGHDILTVGLKRNTGDTIAELTEWADKIITTAQDQADPLKELMKSWNHGVTPSDWSKHELWNIGPDNFPRPYNAELLRIVTDLIDAHKDELKP